MRRLLVPALLVYSVILFRAAYQSVTLDEADAFMTFATGNLDISFYPSSGNHVLNSLLARYTTQVFGLSQFTFRIPAMLGALLYLLSVAAIVTRLAPTRHLLAFAILTCNPFILDYLVASRGYALALGFLAAMVALAMRILDRGPTPIRDTILISICAALAVAANFSFAFCIAGTLGAFLLSLPKTKRWFALALAATIPGAIVGFAIVGKTLMAFPRDQLYYGAHSWPEMWTEMLDAVFPKQNLQLASIEPVLTAARGAAPYFILLPISIGLWMSTKSWPTRFVALALAATLTAHGLAHSIQNLLLPLDRTSIFIAFFLSVLAVISATHPPAQRISTTALCASLLIFALAFRTSYFRIWEFDMDVNRGFEAYLRYAKDHKIESAACTWRYGGAYNFYRAASKADIPKCDYIDQSNPPPRTAYFLWDPGEAEFIEKSKLEILYKGPISGLVVGIRSGSATEP